MTECPQCQAQVSPKARFCPSCGAAIPVAAAPAAAESPTTYTPAPGRAVAPVPPPSQAPAAPPAPANSAPPSPAYSAPAPANPPRAAAPFPAARRAAPVVSVDGDESAESDAPRLSLRYPYALVEGHASLVQVEVENTGVTPIDGGELTLESRSLESLVLKNFRRLAPGQTQRFDLEVDPARAGHAILQVGLTVNDRAGRRAYHGTHPLRVLAKPEGQINISIGDIQSNTGGGANAGLGADYGNVSISNLLGDRRIETLNDLLTTELATEFQDVALDLDYGLSAIAVTAEAASRRLHLTLPSAFLAHAQAARRCTLEPLDGGPGPITLITGPEFKLGRSRTEADFATWWWPRHADHDERSRRISKVHALLAADVRGLYVWDNGSSNGTTCDGQPLPADGRAGATHFTRRASLVLAHDYGLDVEYHPPTYEHGPSIRGIERWSGPAVPPPALGGGVSFTPTACASTPFTSLWLLSDVAFGSSAAQPLTLAGEGIAELHGRFHWHRGCFWVEGIGANAPLHVDHHQVRPGEIIPLTRGARLRLGAHTWRLELE
jgi:hypothetical protein